MTADAVGNAVTVITHPAPWDLNAGTARGLNILASIALRARS
ncbi:hypothetical protein [Phytoactinopolyspora halophila]|nr:hypothetical protein [Phytoactinopolyspora halophila]